MKTVDAMIGKEEIIINQYGLPPISNKHYPGECPLCSKRKKFRLTRGPRGVNYICVCGNGSLIGLIMNVTGKDFSTIAGEIDEFIGNTEFKPQRQATQPRERYLNRFSAIQTLRGSPVEAYLKEIGRAHV